MSSLDAELARFEAELAGRPVQLPGPPAPSGPVSLLVPQQGHSAGPFGGHGLPAPHGGQAYPPVHPPQQLPPPPGFRPPPGLGQQLPAPPGFRPPPMQQPGAPYGVPAGLPSPPMMPAYRPQPPPLAQPAYASQPTALPQPAPAYVPQPAPIAQLAPTYEAVPAPQGARQPTSYYTAPAGPAPPAAAPAYVPPASAPSGSYAMSYSSPATRAAPQQSPADALASVKAALQQQAQEKKKKPPAVPRAAGGEKWWDPTLVEWAANDFRIFVGDLGNEVNDDVLQKSFQKFTSFVKGKVVRDKRTNKTKGYGFVSFTDPIEGAKALREMDGSYIGNRPCKLRKSTWDERIDQQQVNKKKRKGQPDGKPMLNHKKHVGVLHR